MRIIHCSKASKSAGGSMVLRPIITASSPVSSVRGRRMATAAYQHGCGGVTIRQSISRRSHFEVSSKGPPHGTLSLRGVTPTLGTAAGSISRSREMMLQKRAFLGHSSTMLTLGASQGGNAPMQAAASRSLDVHEMRCSC